MPCLQIPGIPPKQFCHDSIGNWVPFVIMRQHKESRGHAISCPCNKSQQKALSWNSAMLS